MTTRKERMPILIAAILLGALAAGAQSYVGSLTLTPGITPGCVELRPSTSYAVQAVMATQQYTTNPYLHSSVEVFLSSQNVITEVGPMPIDGGYTDDGGTYFQLNAPVVLKDTDVYAFKPSAPNNYLCHRAGVTADGGVSNMKLYLSRTVP